MNIRIKNILILLLSVTITYSCNNSESNNYMSVSGKIESIWSVSGSQISKFSSTMVKYQLSASSKI